MSFQRFILSLFRDTLTMQDRSMLSGFMYAHGYCKYDNDVKRVIGIVDLLFTDDRSMNCKKVRGPLYRNIENTGPIKYTDYIFGKVISLKAFELKEGEWKDWMNSPEARQHIVSLFNKAFLEYSKEYEWAKGQSTWSMNKKTKDVEKRMEDLEKRYQECEPLYNEILYAMAEGVYDLYTNDGSGSIKQFHEVEHTRSDNSKEFKTISLTWDGRLNKDYKPE